MAEIGVEELGKILDRIDLLFKWMETIHEATNTHDWKKEPRPWEDEKADQFWVRCECGTVRRAVSKREFENAADRYDGY